MKYKTERLLKPSLTRKGYHRIHLCKNGKATSMFIHRLVSEAFLEKNDESLQVNHKNYIRTDNRIENLEWVTQKENIAHSYKRLSPRRGSRNRCLNPAIKVMPRGEGHHKSKLKDCEAWLVKKLAFDGLPKSQIAKMFRISRCCASDIARGYRRKHINLDVYAQ